MAALKSFSEAGLTTCRLLVMSGHECFSKKHKNSGIHELFGSCDKNMVSGTLCQLMHLSSHQI